jgi:tetratricopeptide (TPR) repeat protein
MLRVRFSHSMAVQSWKGNKSVAPLMRMPSRRSLIALAAAACLLNASVVVAAQTGSDAADQAKRRQAIILFEHGQRLEALPLLAELATANPKDAVVLVEYAACLIDHAATLPDQQAAGQERLHARELLNRAWELGDTSTLALNLSQLLNQLPESGAIKFSDNMQADQAIRAGEAAFSRRDFEQALKDYTKALEWEPRSYTATLFIANTYDRQRADAKAAEWYERAIRLDPDIETAYRYYADLLAKQGDMAKSRRTLIEAAVAEPYNRMVWRELHAWASLNHTQINEVYVSVPPLPVAETAHGANNSPAAWRTYHAVKADWKREIFAKRFPQEKEYRHSLAEESEALAAAADQAQRAINDQDGGGAASSEQAVTLLLKLQKSGLLDAYILFSLGDAGIARDYASYRSKNREKLEQYLDQFVVPPPS